ncbi:hypothetical protein JYB88_06755 [Shewanella cyperi]|uniref:PilZ domain-containing protein n=1 Tax=Shewanella cyperi TaxID=2814292 RepID=A0A974XQ42_9GAMM|nr:hypothetical protein [Shewanella cyperi]QSX31328.1 hypothetical protein JYB88_06755 [Shewanella cyperi]
MQTDPDAFFSVPHTFRIYARPWTEPALPDDAALAELRSMGMQLLNEAKALEATSLMQLRQLGSDTKALVDYLKLQSRKVDMVLHYVLANDPHEGEPLAGLRFGGSGVTLRSPTAMADGSRHLLTLYIREELIALLCVAEVRHCVHEDDGFRVTLEFVAISDADTEQLVRASLSVQQKQLKLRKQQQEG